MTIGSIGGTYGLSGSGMDIDSIVKKLMTREQAKADALLQKKTVLQWQKTAYNTVYDDVNAFRTTAFNYKLQGTLSPNKVSSSNTLVATATATADATAVNHSLVVSQLASGVKLTSTAVISTHQPPILGTLATQLSMPTTPINIKITNGSAASLTILIYPQTDTLNDVVSKFNNAGVNVKANYDLSLDRFFLTTTNTGASSGISFVGSDQNGLNFLGGKLKLSGGTAETFAGSGIYISTPVNGQDATFQLDGVGLTKASNKFTISDVTYNLTGVSTGTPLTPTNVSVTNDIDTAVASIQSLVDSYNKILAEVNGKVNETRYKGYPPLTDAQKTAMKDSDITAWNAKAQSGMLHNDSSLTSLVNAMRNAFSGPVSGVPVTNVSGVSITYNSAASIGITTGSNYTEGGKLYLDTNKLRTALQANPNVLNQLFGPSGQTTTNGVTTTNSQSQGIAGRLYDGIKNTMDQLAQIAGTTGNAQYDTTSNVAKTILNTNKQISDGATRFDTIQKAYYTKYNAMEVALNKMNSQSSWLSSTLSKM